MANRGGSASEGPGDRWGRIPRTHKEPAQHHFMALQDSAGGKVHHKGICDPAQEHGMSGGLRVKHRMELSLLSKGCKIRLIPHPAVRTRSSTAANLCWSTQVLSVGLASLSPTPSHSRTRGLWVPSVRIELHKKLSPDGSSTFYSQLPQHKAHQLWLFTCSCLFF